MEKVGFGIDIGGTSIKAGLFLQSGELAGEWRVPTRIGENGKYIYDDAAAMVQRAMEAKGIAPENVLGVGVDVPCPVREDGSTGIGSNIKTTGGFPAEEISKRLGGMRVEVTNDANAAGLGEYWMGAGKDCRSLCMVTLGTGVGGAVIHDGKIIAGVHGTGGELGHIIVEPDEIEQCGCGARGCVEQYASATGLVRVAKRILWTGDPMTPVTAEKRRRFPHSPLAGLGEEINAKIICDKAREGDELACRTLDFAMDCLARALVTVGYVTDPEIFVIGGGVSEAGDVLLDRLREKTAGGTNLHCGVKPVIVQAKLGNKAGIYGAAAQLMQ